MRCVYGVIMAPKAREHYNAGLNIYKDMDLEA